VGTGQRLSLQHLKSIHNDPVFSFISSGGVCVLLSLLLVLRV
jgi:hypothetical protein